jgi:hypothetical protein
MKVDILREEIEAGASPKDILERAGNLLEIAKATWPKRRLVWSLGSEIISTLRYLDESPVSHIQLATWEGLLGHPVLEVPGRALLIEPTEALP